MSLPEDTIMKYLDWHLTQSEPGSVLHHLSVTQAPIDAVTPFGTIDETKTHSTVCVVAPLGDVTEQLIADALERLRAEAVRDGEIIVMAVLSQEVWLIPPGADRQLARRLLAEGKQLGEHPEATEATMLYAAIRDGRRWRGRRHLTGPRAGETEDLELLVGSPRGGESHGIRAERLIRQMVGIAG